MCVAAVRSCRRLFGRYSSLYKHTHTIYIYNIQSCQYISIYVIYIYKVWWRCAIGAKRDRLYTQYLYIYILYIHRGRVFLSQTHTTSRRVRVCWRRVSRTVTDDDCGGGKPRETLRRRGTQAQYCVASAVMPRDWRQRHRRRQVATRKPRANVRGDGRTTGREGSRCIMCVCTRGRDAYVARASSSLVCRTSSVRSTKRDGVTYTPAWRLNIKNNNNNIIVYVEGVYI